MRGQWHGTRILALTLAVCAGSACSGPYLKNRWQDSKDVFTATLESDSYGGALRLGPVKAGAHYHASGEARGLRGGAVGTHNSADFTAFFFGADYFSDREIRFDSWRPKTEADAEAEAERQALLENLPADASELTPEQIEALKEAGALPADFEAGDLSDLSRLQNEAANATDPDANADLPGGETESPDRALLAVRGKLFRALSPLGTERPAHKYKSLLKDDTTDWAPAYYFTQLELQLGFFVGLRLGWNAGETVDWLAGWFGFDPLSDDAPYRNDLEEQLEKIPAWQLLSDEEKEAVRQRLREGGGTDGGLLPF